ncbi:MAG: hypothetical protein CMI56_00480 [Parcubacteria group bacterium]|nr:hypothetical protein [Parcubacteria group bacterium]|tara:strand:- start:23821 stop:24129 length:309 start_codon:yes stop_codon:yes gene_type:complete
MHIPIEKVLLASRGTCHHKECLYKNRYCPQYWHAVFCRYYLSPPVSDKDPRWDELFRIGFPIYDTLEEGDDRKGGWLYKWFKKAAKYAAFFYFNTFFKYVAV